MKKIVLFSCLAFGVACAAESDVTSLDGFYAGLGLSFDHSEFETEDTTDNLSVHKTKMNALGGSVALGYNHGFGSFFTGLEATLDACKNKKFSSTDGSVNFKNKNKGGYTVRLMALYNF